MFADTETRLLSQPSQWSWAQRFSLNDGVTAAYLLGLNLAWALAEPSPGLARSGPLVLVLLLTYLLLVAGIARSNTSGGWWRALCYRLGHFGCVHLSYFVFAGFLPAVNSGSLDAELYALDLTWFGMEPALYFDGFVSSESSEWFSFFYYGYFLLLASHIFPIVFFGRDHRVLAEFALGMTLVCTIGQTCYMLVPGFGPYHHTPELFQNQLPPGFWWDLVTDVVDRGGAQKDIFPSLHTALPTFILLFSFHNRGLYPYRYTWPIVAFVTGNIVIATMFLRWHYLIDIVAGLLLASSAYVASVHATKWEARRRAQLGVGRVWPSWSG